MRERVLRSHCRCHTQVRLFHSACLRACWVHGCRSCKAKGCAAVRGFLSAQPHSTACLPTTAGVMWGQHGG